MKKKRQPISKKDKEIATVLQTKQKEESQQYFVLLNQQKKQAFTNRIIDYYGKNTIINYKPEFNFVQEWETKETTDNINTSSLLEAFGTSYTVYAILSTLLKVVCIWTITVERYFEIDQISRNSDIYLILILSDMIDIALKTWLKYRQNFSCPGPLYFLKTYYSFLPPSLYCVLKMLEIDNLAVIILEFVVIYFLYKQAAEIYGHVKMMEFGLQYQNYIKIFDLLINILIQAHTFAVVLYCASKINPQINWVRQAGIESETFMVKYANSIYFACTTMLTIGYGDITPRSLPEKIITVIIEIVGVIAFGYLLNQMGHTLSKMREQRQIMERDLQTISKISKYYNLEPKLQNQAKKFIFSNQSKSEDLNIQDENRLLMKLNEDLRQEINLENSLNIVKSSIFFLCQWSKDMQTEVAKRLEKRIFSPNQKLAGKRIYIIKKGRVDVYMNKLGSQQAHLKVLKTIDMSTKLEVSDNIYGYTSLFSNRPTRLQAVAKDFTSTYSITGEDLLLCISQKITDFEYYHEIKSRIDQSELCEEWEAPGIKNQRHHYCPTHFLVIKKHKFKLGKKKNSRKFQRRSVKRQYQLISGLYTRSQTGNFDSENTIIFSSKHLKVQNIENEIQKIYQNLANNKYSEPTEQNRLRQPSSTVLQEGQCEHTNQNKMTLIAKPWSFRSIEMADLQMTAGFEMVRQFRNFFPKNNLSNILYNLEKENSLERRFTCPIKK